MTPSAVGRGIGAPHRRRSKWAGAGVVLLSAVVGAVALTASATAAVPRHRPAAVGTGTAPAGWARPDAVGLPPGWTLTWSTGPLPDAGAPIALSSPVPADLDGQPSVVVGDRQGRLYAYHLASSSSSGTPATGWPASVSSGPIDSTPSVAPAGGGLSTVFVGSGNDEYPVSGGYQALFPTGTRKWYTPVVNPASDTSPSGGVQAGLTIGTLHPGGVDAFAGSLGQVSYALDTSDGHPLTGWPFFNSDSTHSTAALADLYGSGRSEVIVGGDQTAGSGRGQTYTDGGHLRVLTATGAQVCRADTDQVVDSSPAVGGFLPGGATGIVVGTGDFFPGASDTDTVKAYDSRCDLQWTARLDGSTFSSPALSTVLGNGTLQVVEGTDQGAGGSGSVWVLDAATGHTVWVARDIGRVIGSVVTADLTGAGYDDVIVPTISGTLVFDGRSGAQVATLSPYLGLQNAPLVTDDPNGTVGITLAGYTGGAPGGIGRIDHYEIAGSDGALAVGAGSWPMFHHDPQLTGNAGGTTPRGSLAACDQPAAIQTGYDLAASDGGIFSFPAGGMPFCGSTGGQRLNRPVVAMAMAPRSGGYWEAASDGGIFAFGGARFFGSMGGRHLNSPVVGMAATPDGGGYWEVAADGGIFAFGDARFLGSVAGDRLNEPVVGMSATADGNGYRLVASDGGIFTFGDAPYAGSKGGEHLNAPVVATVNDPDTGGYWEVASDGGVFAFGGARYLGSMGGRHLNSPVVGMAATANGSGYELVAADGGVFTFGSAAFQGSMGGKRLQKPVVTVAGF
jgi:hypothetical protein